MKKYDIPVHEQLCKSAYCVQQKDLIGASKVMAAAFSDDASIRYLLGGESEGVNDWKYFLCVLKSICGKCIMLSTDELIQSLLVLFPPQLKSVPIVPVLLNSGINLGRDFGMSFYLRLLRYENNCKAVKCRYAAPGSWYCMCFVVDPQTQGQGVGSRLIKPVLNITKRNHIPLYLETHKRHNVDIYQYLGFTTVGKSKIPKTEIEQYSMITSPVNQ